MRTPTRWIVAAVLLVALGLRIGFVLLMPSRTLYWDEPHYDNCARLFARVWSAQPADYGAEPAFAEALRCSLQKGLGYAATVAIVYSVAGTEPRAVFVVQAVLDTLVCWLLYGLARALGGVRAGLFTLVLAALYQPFVFSAARLQTETLASVLCVGALWGICVAPRQRVGTFAGGVLAAASMLARPALQFLLPVLLLAVLVRNWDRAWRDRLSLALIFALGFFALVAPSMLIVRAGAGQWMWAGTLDPSIDMYGGAVIGNVGWKTDRQAFAYPPSDELLAVVGDDPTRRLQRADFVRATFRTWALHPLDSAAVALHKLYVAWLYPYNDSRWTLLISPDWQRVWHRTLVLLALVGMPMALHNWRIGIPLIGATIYLWLTYVAIKIEVRYAVMPMPLMMCFAGVALASVSRGWQFSWQAGRWLRPAMLAAAIAISLGGVCWLSVARLLELLPISPAVAHGMRVALILVIIGLVASLAAMFVPHRRGQGVALVAAPAVFAALVVLFGRPLAQTWHEWQCTLTANRGTAQQEFSLPKTMVRPSAAYLELDLLPGSDGAADVVVRVNGREMKRYSGGPTRADADSPKRGGYASLAAARRRENLADKAWYTIPIPVELVVPGTRLSVEVDVEGAGAVGSLTIFGDHSSDPTTYVGPSLFSPRLLADTSLYKYLAEDDFRLRRRVTVSSSGRSRFHDGSTWSERDLAPEPGRQQGRYRIFLLLEYVHGVAIM